MDYQKKGRGPLVPHDHQQIWHMHAHMLWQYMCAVALKGCYSKCISMSIHANKCALEKKPQHSYILQYLQQHSNPSIYVAAPNTNSTAPNISSDIAKGSHINNRAQSSSATQQLFRKANKALLYRRH